MASNKIVCKKCRKLVSDNCNSICCDNCSNWFHQKRNCSGLKTKDFNKFVKNTQLSWVCTFCNNYKCVCDKPVFNFQNGIRCDLCLNWLHLHQTILKKILWNHQNQWKLGLLLLLLPSFWLSSPGCFLWTNGWLFKTW